MAEKILPYWHDTTPDYVNGGYILSDDVQGKAEKQIVTQSRLIWGFSHVHLKGYSTAERNYLKAAEHGYRFLISKFLDQKNGGYFWTTDLKGKVLNHRKFLYAQAFVIYGLVEYYRASNDNEALHQATALYRQLQQRAYDKRNGGWIEHFARDWKPLLQPTPKALIEIGGYKSANAHLHLMESLAELYDVTRDKDIKRALDEAVRLNCTYFYPQEVGRSCLHRQSDWKEAPDNRSYRLSFGHNVEFAWLLIRSQKVLGMPPAWEHFYALLNHALTYGYDHKRGGVYYCGIDDKPASQTDKVWWPQAEMLAALTEALVHKPNSEHEVALKQLLDFVATFMTDRSSGVWFDTVTAAGRLKKAGTRHNWKANYHDVRAMLKFIEAFYSGITPGPATSLPTKVLG